MWAPAQGVATADLSVLVGRRCKRHATRSAVPEGAPLCHSRCAMISIDRANHLGHRHTWPDGSARAGPADLPAGRKRFSRHRADASAILRAAGSRVVVIDLWGLAKSVAGRSVRVLLQQFNGSLARAWSTHGPNETAAVIGRNGRRHNARQTISASSWGLGEQHDDRPARRRPAPCASQVRAWTLLYLLAAGS